MTFKEIQAVHPDIPRRTLQDDLMILKKEAFVNTKGRGSAAFWFLKKKARS